MSALAELLKRKHLESQLKENRRITISELAKSIGVSQQELSAWMLGQKKPYGKNVKLLVDYYGVEVYEALEMKTKIADDNLRWLIDNWEQIAEAVRDEIIRIAQGEERKVVYPVLKEKPDGRKTKKSSR